MSHVPLLLSVAQFNRAGLSTDDRRMVAQMLRPLKRQQRVAAYQRIFVTDASRVPRIALRYAQLTLAWDLKQYG